MWLLGAMLTMSCLAAGAWAYFSSTGTSTAAASIGSVGAPASASAQQSGSDITITWGAATLSGGGAVDGYRVTRSDATTICGGPALETALSCTDTDAPAGSHAYTVTAVFHNFTASNTSTPITTLSAPAITSKPSSPSAATAPTFGFSGSTLLYECRLDGGSFSPCVSPLPVSGLADGSHIFSVHAVQGGSTGPDSSYSWILDAAAPTIAGAPSDPSAATAASFSLSHAEAGYTFSCQLDGGGFSTCTSPKSYAGLAAGTHTFDARAISADGATTAATSHAWTVDTTAPAIVTKPSNPSAKASPLFSFTHSQAAYAFDCKLDGASFTACTAPQIYAVADGAHTFSVRARSADGAVTAANSYTWTVDTTAPAITAKPGSPSASAAASFSFTHVRPGYTFACTLDGGSSTACASPFTSSGLAPGGHTFTVVGMDASGNATTAASYSWSIVTSAPSFTAKPTDPSARTSSSFSFTHPGYSSFRCKLDAASFASCVSPRTIATGSGQHTFSVQALDGAGVTTDIASYSWLVDVSAPAITSKPPSTSTTSSASFAFTHAQSAYGFQCRLDAATAASCTSPQSYSGVADGSHTFTLNAVDASGALTSASTYSWTVDATAPAVSLASAAGLMWANNTSPSTIGFANADATGSNQSLVAGLPNTRGTFSDGRYLWWASDNGSIGRANRDGSNAIAGFVTGGGSFDPGMASDGTYLYWGDRNANRIDRISLNAPSGTSPTVIVAGANQPYGVAISGSHIYWTQQGATIGRANLDGTGVNSAFLSTGFSQLVGLAADGSNLWIGDQGSSQILRVGLDASGNTTGTLAAIVSGTNRPFGMSTDGTYIYWSNQGSGAVGRSLLDGSGATQSFVSGGNVLWTAAVVPASTTASVAGSTIYFNGSVAGSLTIANAITDTGTGPASVTFPEMTATGWTHAAESVTASSGSGSTRTYTSKAFSWTAGATTPGGAEITSSDAAGNARTTPLTFVNDTSAPASAAMSVNGTAATGAGSASTSSSTSFPIDSRTNYTTDGQSGLRSSALTVQSATLTSGTCGSPGSGGPFVTPAAITATTQAAGILAGFCYRYTLTGTDNVGNAASISTTVRVPPPFVYVAIPGPPKVSQFNAFGGPLSAISPPSVTASGSPLWVAIAPNGKSAYVTNRDGGITSPGNVMQYDIDQATGALTAKTPATVAAGSGPYGIAVNADSKSVYVVSQGANSVLEYDVNATTGALSPKTPASVATGSSPYIITVNPDGKSAYVTNQGGGSISQYTIDQTTGALAPKSPAVVLAGDTPDSVTVSADGKNAYVTNQSSLDISQYNISPTTGALTALSPATVSTNTGSGSHPFGIVVSPDGKSVYATDFTSNVVLQYDRSATTGALTFKTVPKIAAGSTPWGLTVSPDSKSVYVANQGGSSVLQYDVNAATGALSPKAIPSVALGGAPVGLAVTPR
jgi:6-phosphogluconolactonase (cycloisomerase 2 family)